MSQQTRASVDDHLRTTTGSAGGGRLRLVDHAYRAIRDDLITLRIAPGEALDDKHLSAELHVGLTPVRDAIKRLTLERLVVTYPRRGTFAAEIQISDERWLTEVRIGPEGLAAALAAERATEADRSRLADLAQKLEESRLTTAYVDHDAAIHRAIYAAARNPYLEATLNQYANAALRIWHYALRSLGPNLPPPCKQAEVVGAILARDSERAKAAAEAHLREYSVEVRRLLLLDPSVGTGSRGSTSS